LQVAQSALDRALKARPSFATTQDGKMAQKILMVDDDPLMHRLFQRQLERAGYQMVSATNGLEALEVVERELPQLIVMDIMMAGMDGLGAIRQLKKKEATKDIPVIVVTAEVSAHDASRRESEAAGAACFLTKPLSPAKLLEEIQRLIGKPSE
jgi:CheY-like chemotaxis protein